jgi:hypothetical protein
MAHRRSQIVAAVAASLAAIPEFSYPRKVARGRFAAVPQELLPAITLSWGEAGENSSRRPSSGPNGEDGYDRSLALSVIVHLRDADAEEEFDRISALIEARMEQDVTIGGRAVDLELQTTRLFVDPRTGLPLGAGNLTYQVRFKTIAIDPSAAAL